MRARDVLSVATASMLAASVAAQSARPMDTAPKGKMMSMTYTGCLQAANHGGTLVLLTDGGDAGMDAMHHETMKDDAAMKHAPMVHDDSMHRDEMMNTAAAIVLTGSADLKTHVGQRISVTGPLSKSKEGAHGYLSTVTVKTLSVVATSCSTGAQP